MIRLVLPWPPSVNVYWRHVGAKVLISEAGRAYARTVYGIWTEARLRGQIQPFILPVRVDIVAYQPNKRMRDLDNLLKAPLDAITKAKMWTDDSLIDDLRIRWGAVGDGKPGTLAVTIESTTKETK